MKKLTHIFFLFLVTSLVTYCFNHSTSASSLLKVPQYEKLSSGEEKSGSVFSPDYQKNQHKKCHSPRRKRVRSTELLHCCPPAELCLQTLYLLPAHAASLSKITYTCCLYSVPKKRGPPSGFIS
jgi:hypothetical protein